MTLHNKYREYKARGKCSVPFRIVFRDNNDNVAL